MENILINMMITIIICRVYLFFYEKENEKIMREFLIKIETLTIETVKNNIK